MLRPTPNLILTCPKRCNGTQRVERQQRYQQWLWVHL